jgi:hypothetical protein
MRGGIPYIGLFSTIAVHAVPAQAVFAKPTNPGPQSPLVWRGLPPIRRSLDTGNYLLFPAQPRRPLPGHCSLLTDSCPLAPSRHAHRQFHIPPTATPENATDRHIPGFEFHAPTSAPARFGRQSGSNCPRQFCGAHQSKCSFAYNGQFRPSPASEPRPCCAAAGVAVAQWSRCPGRCPPALAFSPYRFAFGPWPNPTPLRQGPVNPSGNRGTRGGRFSTQFPV